jgi:hypothetical protein
LDAERQLLFLLSIDLELTGERPVGVIPDNR